MILAEKISDLRKQAGWSQEELADKLEVSRQSVSKWEMAQSVPDMNRIIMMAKLFGVSTDYLLLDDMEAPSPKIYEGDTDELPISVHSVSMEEANRFLDVRFTAATQIALGVMLCILCPVLVIILEAGRETGRFALSEPQAAGFGCIFLFICLIAAVAMFVMNGIRLHMFSYFEEEEIDTAYGVDGFARERRERFRGMHTRDLVLGISLCVGSVMPLFVGLVLFGEEEFAMSVCTTMMLAMIAVGVFLIVRCSIIWGSFQMLLQEGDYSLKEKVISRKNAPIAGVYWSLVTALYLGYSFITQRWDHSWIIWPIAGVSYAVLAGILRVVRNDDGRY